MLVSQYHDKGHIIVRFQDQHHRGICMDLHSTGGLARAKSLLLSGAQVEQMDELLEKNDKMLLTSFLKTNFDAVKVNLMYHEVGGSSQSPGTPLDKIGFQSFDVLIFLTF